MADSINSKAEPVWVKDKLIWQDWEDILVSGDSQVNSDTTILLSFNRP